MKRYDIDTERLKQAILDLGGEATAVQVAAKLGVPKQAIAQSMGRLISTGDLRNTGRVPFRTPSGALVYHATYCIGNGQHSDPTEEEIYRMAAELRAERSKRGKATPEDYVAPVVLKCVRFVPNQWAMEAAALPKGE